jgi:HSP20 family protein
MMKEGKFMADKTLESKTRARAASCDIYSEDGKVILSMEMPGISKEDLDIRVDNDHLLIHGKMNAKNPDGRFLLREMQTGDYHNDFSLDDTIDRTSIEATVKNGIVTISLGIREDAKPRKINVVAK